MLHLVTPNLNDFKKNKFGVEETTSQINFEGNYDMILVPGAVFDREGYRIGYGGGYYDYFLAGQTEVLKAGVGFPLQLNEGIPHEAHDVPVDILILGEHFLNFR